MRKKVLYIVTKSNWGGAQKYVFDLSSNLPKDEFEAVVVTGGDGMLVEELARNRIRTIVLPAIQPTNGFFEVVFSIKNLLILIWLLSVLTKENPDYIHLNSSKIGGLGALAGSIYKLLGNRSAKIFFTVHGWGFKEDRSPLIRWPIFLLCWLSSLMQDKIILINTADLKSARKFIPERKLVLINNGLGPIDFFSRKEARQFFSQRVGQTISDETILVGTNAELVKNKGLGYLVESLHMLKSQNLKFLAIIIGEGKEQEQLTKKIENFQLKSLVFLIGFVPEARRYMKGLDIFVLPSLKEGLPYALMEAMAAGVAPVATAVGGISDLATDNKEGCLVPAKDAGKLASGIKHLAVNVAERKKIGEAAAKKISYKFGLHDMIEKTVALYNE